MANKIWANFHGVYLVGMSMRSSSRRQSCIRSAMRLTILGESMLVLSSGCQVALLRKGTTPLPHNDAALDQEAAEFSWGATEMARSVGLADVFHLQRDGGFEFFARFRRLLQVSITGLRRGHGTTAFGYPRPAHV